MNLNIKALLSFKNIFTLIYFILLSSSLAYNIFGICKFRPYFSSDDSLTVGRMVQSEKNGLFSEGGFPCVIFDITKVPDSIKSNPDMYEITEIRDTIFNYNWNISNQYRYYTGEDENIPDNVYPYLSQTGGNSLLWSIVSMILPFNPYIKLNIIRFLNAALLATMFLFFTGWCRRNFGYVPAIIVCILIFLTPWITYLGGSMWWCIWSYYIPFLTMLLLLEQRNKYRNKINDNKIFIALFFAVFLKHLLFGFEFSSTVLLAIYPPIVYYYLIEKRTFKSFFVFSLKSGVVSLFAIIMQTMILLYQISLYKRDGIISAFRYILGSFTRRSTLEKHQDLSYLDTLKTVFKDYFMSDAFDSRLWLSNNVISYMGFICIVIILSIIIYLFIKKNTENINKYTAIIITTAVSILCPLSWYIIFLEHALFHLHRDFIVWYVPFMLYCYLIVGIAFQLLIKFIFESKNILNHEKNNQN